MHLAADPAGQERRHPAIFPIPDDRVADRRHVRAQLVRASGQRLQFDPRRAIARAVDQSIAGPCRLAIFLVDMHLLAAGPGLLGERGVDHALVEARHPRDDRPIDFARGSPRERLGEMPRGARRARHHQDAAGILVEAVDQFGPVAVVVGQPVEQAVEMLVGLGPALRREARRLVEHHPVAAARDHHVADIGLLVVGQRHDHPRRTTARTFGGRRLGGGDAQDLARFDPVARRDALAIDADLPGPCPARDEVEAGVGQVPLEPAVEADPVIVRGDGEGPHIVGAGAHRAPLARSGGVRHRPMIIGALLDPADEGRGFGAFPRAVIAVLARAAVDPPALPRQAI